MELDELKKEFRWFNYDDLIVYKTKPKAADPDNKDYIFLGKAYPIDGLHREFTIPDESEFSRLVVGEQYQVGYLTSLEKDMYFVQYRVVELDTDRQVALFTQVNSFDGEFVRTIHPNHNDLYTFILSQRRKDFIDRVLTEL